MRREDVSIGDTVLWDHTREGTVSCKVVGFSASGRSAVVERSGLGLHHALMERVSPAKTCSACGAVQYDVGHGCCGDSCTLCDKDYEGRRVMEFPGHMASYKKLDAWLRDRGWIPEDKRCTVWRLMVGRTVRIRTLGAAIDTQLRRDRAKRASPPETQTPVKGEE